MKTPTKFKFEINGETFQLPIKHLRTKDYKGNPVEPKIIMAQTATANVVKQYVKKHYSNVVVQSSSSSFSMGNSVDVYITDERGGEVDDKIIKAVKSFGDRFVYGRFNGMEDMYELSDRSGMETDSGTPIDASVKYLHINNRPKFCSVPDVYRMIYDMTQTTNYVFGQISMEKAVSHIKGYGATDVQINKAKALINY